MEPTEKVILCILLDEWIAHCETRGRSPNTLHGYRRKAARIKGSDDTEQARNDDHERNDRSCVPAAQPKTAQQDSASRVCPTRR